jgi:5'-3' exonuclease
MNSIILIDTSYTNFYRFYATIRWYSFAFADNFKQENTNEYDWSTNTIFMEKFEKMYLSSIINIVSKDIFDNSIIIFCMDSDLNTLWKTKKYADYKYKRKMIIKKYNYINVFKYTFDIIIPNLIKNNNNIYHIKINKLEADDIIGCICIYLKNTENNIYIISNDNDLLQLGRNNIYFFNYKLKKITSITEEEASLILKKKKLKKKLLYL